MKLMKRGGIMVVMIGVLLSFFQQLKCYNERRDGDSPEYGIREFTNSAFPF